MGFCRSCGIRIPERQEWCSACYGDPFYGTDGILLDMMEQDARYQEMERLYQEEIERVEKKEK